MYLVLVIPILVLHLKQKHPFHKIPHNLVDLQKEKLEIAAVLTKIQVSQRLSVVRLNQAITQKTSRLESHNQQDLNFKGNAKLDRVQQVQMSQVIL